MKYLIIFSISFALGLLIIFITGHYFYLFNLFSLIIYPILIGFIIWFGITLIKVQRERNDILTEISNKLEQDKK